MKNRIKEIRTKDEITQKEIANKVDVTRQYISLLEKNEVEPSMKVAHQIAKVLGHCIYSIFDLDGTEEYKCLCCNCK